MGNDNNNNNNDESLQPWTCCNDEQTLFLLLYMAFLALVVVLLPTVVAKPLRLLAVFVHEWSHATAAWGSGGTVHHMKVYDHNEGGVTQYSGGCRICIIPAGYVGVSIYAMILVVLSGGRRTATAAAIGWTAALTIALCGYRPNRSLIYLNVGYIIVILAFLCIEWFYYTPILQFVILFLGVFMGWAAIHDVTTDTIQRAVPGSDSHACTTEVCPMCPPQCVGVQWLILALFFQCCGIWIALIQMSNECTDIGWFQCLNGAAGFDFQWDGLHTFADFDGFWNNGP